MPSTPAIQASLTITAKSLTGVSVASTFNQVTNLQFDYFKGMIRVIDAAQGEFFFSLLLVATVTYTVGGQTTVVIS